MNRMIKCEGCHKPAKYLVYEHKEPHCLECMLDAVECKGWVELRSIDEYANTMQRDS
jgi:hypothetical protein